MCLRGVLFLSPPSAVQNCTYLLRVETFKNMNVNHLKEQFLQI